jgi:F-type H+-transporting ATPase subunit a
MKGDYVAAPGKAIDPIYQFEVNPIIPIKIGGIDFSFTNASLWMFVVLGAALALMVYGTRNRSLVPDRLQSAAEMTYEFVASTVRGSAGHEGMKFFPFVFSLFLFVLFSNLAGLIPGSFTVTSQIIVTFAFALLVISTVIIYGVLRHGTHFLHLFVPSGLNPLLTVFVTIIEVISFLSRPISLAVRLFANMLAGHITLKVFGGFVTMLLGAGAFAALAPLPLLGVIAIYALELLVALLQAYVFTILTCVYLNDAIHPGH